MGLDISYFRNVTKADVVFNEAGDPIDPITREERDDLTRLYVNNDFPSRADHLETGYYEADGCDGFSAGPYSAYNRWREELAKMAGYPPKPLETYGRVERRHDAGAWAATEGPFWELISFSDCEGVIGPITSAKLAKDFAAFDETAKAIPPGIGRTSFYEMYQRFRTAFEAAADTGAVKFH